MSWMFLSWMMFACLGCAELPAELPEPSPNYHFSAHDEEDFDPLKSPTQLLNRAERTELERVVNQAFTKTHDGWSSDEVILNTQLNSEFIKACSESIDRTQFKTELSEYAFNWTLLNLRKAGKLKSKATRRAASTRSFLGTHLAEIAARSLQDKYKLSSDKVMAHPKLRREFDHLISEQVEASDFYQYRKAAFRLRKTRRLKPELVLRVADWKIDIQHFKASDLSRDISKIPETPGIYIFSDKSGYLYIGEAIDLRARLEQHLDSSDRQSLASYLARQKLSEIKIEIHAFDPKSKGKQISARRAYESELIRSRKPKFNVRP